MMDHVWGKRSTVELLESRCLFAVGDLDPTFGTNGIVQQLFEHGTVFINAVEPVANDKFIIAGTIPTQSHHQSQFGSYLLQRYNADGTIDPTFGSGGTATGNFIIQSNITHLAVLPDGKLAAIVFEEANGAGGSNYHLLARFNEDGSVDTTFGTNGFVTLKVEPNRNQTWVDLDVQSDGKMVVQFDNKVQRYNTDGSLDSSFGSGGIATGVLPFGSLSESVRVLGSGKILVGGANKAGLAQTGNGEAVVAELNSDGSINSSFGTNGVATIDYTPNDTVFGDAQDMAETSDGKIIVTGNSGGFGVARLDSNGQLDATFGTNGVESIPAPNGARQVLLDNQGQIYIIGGNAEAARLMSDSTLDPDFGTVVSDPDARTAFNFSAGAGALVGGRLIIGEALFRPEGGAGYRVLGRLTQDDGKPAAEALTNRVFSVTGTNGNDRIEIRQANSAVIAAVNGFGRSFPASDMDTVSVTGGDGNDVIDARGVTLVPANVSGGNGRDKITGTDGNDTLAGNGGRDFIDGGLGADLISGGGGNDQIRGQGGADHLYGGAGNDYLEGDGGDDQLTGGPGTDVLHGNAANDSFFTNDGEADSLFGDGGTDSAILDSLDSANSIELL
jgi:uncharacterized delta-60 repeat protein